MTAVLIHYYIYLVLLYFTKIVSCFLIFCPNIKNIRERFVLRLIIVIVVAIGVSTGFFFLFYYTFNYFALMAFNVVLFVLMLLSYYFIFDYKLKDAATIIVVSYCVQHISYQILFLLFTCWAYDVFNAYNNAILYWTILWLDIILQIVLNIILSGLLQGIFKKNNKFSMSFPKAFGFSVASILVISILYTRVYLTEGYLGNIEVQVVVSTFCILSCVLILFLMLRVSDVDKYRDEIIETNVFNNNIIKQYKKSQESLEYINIKCHDLRKRLRDYKNNKVIDDEEIENIVSAIRIYENTFNTGNDTLDKVLNSRSLIIQHHNINLTAMCDCKELNVFKEYELISLFTNIIDNAIEAVVKLDKTSNRNISLVIKNKSGFLYIEETNPYIGTVKIKNDYLITNKDNKEQHGYGTRSIVQTVKKYKGKVEYETENNIFSIKILIPLHM